MENVLTTHIDQWKRSENGYCQKLYKQFIELYEIHISYTIPITLPITFKHKVYKWLKNDKTLLDMLNKQPLFNIIMPLTGEHCFFSPIRTQRPRPKKPVNLHMWVNEQSEATKPTCDFCHAMENTATDVLGRNPTKETVRASNTFKVEKYHTLVITKHQHHPLNFTLQTFEAFFDDTANIAREVQQKDPEYMYPNIAWDTLYQAGVSQLHPHIHIMMSNYHYYGYYELLRQSAQRYYQTTNNNLFTILTRIHEALGLTIRYGNAVAFPTIAGKADMEVMFLAPKPSSDLYRLIYFTVNAYHDSFTQLCKGFSGIYPAQGSSNGAAHGTMPVLARLISRGDCTSPRTDYTSFEIFQIVERYHDPWDVAAAIRKSIKKHDHK